MFGAGGGIATRLEANTVADLWRFSKNLPANLPAKLRCFAIAVYTWFPISKYLLNQRQIAVNAGTVDQAQAGYAQIRVTGNSVIDCPCLLVRARGLIPSPAFRCIVADTSHHHVRHAQ